jgi:hypothetical protein
MRRLMKDQKDRATYLDTGRNKRHYGPTRVVGLYDDALACASPISVAVRCLGAKPSGRRIPSLRPGMAMFGCHITRIGDPLRILSCLFFARLHEDRTNFRDARTIGRAPPSLPDGEQPYFPERFDDRSTRSLRCLRRSTGRVRVQVPEDFRAGQSSKWLGYYQPASNIAPGPFADRQARATRKHGQDLLDASGEFRRLTKVRRTLQCPEAFAGTLNRGKPCWHQQTQPWCRR